jgi:hypothetical protein
LGVQGGQRFTGAMFVVGDAVNGGVRGWIATRHTVAEEVVYSMLLVGSKQAKRFKFVPFTSFTFSPSWAGSPSLSHQLLPFP